MIFSDDDLKWCKEHWNDLPYTYDVSGHRLTTLLARLEAAEKALWSANEWIRGGVAGGDVTYQYFDSHYEAWRKAAGK